MRAGSHAKAIASSAEKPLRQPTAHAAVKQSPAPVVSTTCKLETTSPYDGSPLPVILFPHSLAVCWWEEGGPIVPVCAPVDDLQAQGCPPRSSSAFLTFPGQHCEVHGIDGEEIKAAILIVTLQEGGAPYRQGMPAASLLALLKLSETEGALTVIIAPRRERRLAGHRVQTARMIHENGPHEVKANSWTYEEDGMERGGGP